MKVLAHPRLLLIYAVTARGYGGVFTAFGADDAGSGGILPGTAVSWILLGYGVSVAIRQYLGR